MQEGRLPRTGRPEDGDQLAAFDAQVEPAQCNDIRLARAEDLEDVVQLERPPLDLLLTLGLAVEARYLHRKLWTISR